MDRTTAELVAALRLAALIEDRGPEALDLMRIAAASIESLWAERDELRISIHGCSCPAPYDQCVHDEPLLKQVERLERKLLEARTELEAALARVRAVSTSGRGSGPPGGYHELY